MDGVGNLCTSGRRMTGWLDSLPQLEMLAAEPRVGYSLRALAQECQYSPRHFQRLFLKQTGVTPSAWMDKLRLRAAERLLKDKQQIKAIAFKLGFATAGDFARFFKRMKGVSPSGFVRYRTFPPGKEQPSIKWNFPSKKCAKCPLKLRMSA